MSSHVTHRQEGRKHKHHRPLQRGSVLAAHSRGSLGLAEALRRALEDLEANRVQGRVNLADDDEDPTRRAGVQKT